MLGTHTAQAPEYSVLIVDDDPSDQQMFIEYLNSDESQTFRINAAETASQAVKNLEQQNVDCILLDYNLPDSVSFHLLERIIKMEIPSAIVMLTGVGDESLAMAALQNGADDYITKDQCDRQTLMRAVRYAVERKRTQISHKEIERVKQIHEMQRDFFTIATHEFRNPLSVIDTSTQLIEFTHPDDTHTTKYTARIKQSVNKLISLVDNVLAFSQFEAGSMRFQPLNFNFSNFLKETVENFQLMHADRTINLEITGEMDKFHADQYLCDHIFTNLISNALKYSEPQFAVSIKAARVADAIEISVSDSGIGMSNEDVQKLFTKFFRSKNCSAVQGTGIGLYLVKQLVDMHEGSIFVDSTPGMGTTFMVRLPIKQPSLQEELDPDLSACDTILASTANGYIQ